ncbi:MAG: prepilin peptidase [Phycisphaerales bacterium]
MNTPDLTAFVLLAVVLLIAAVTDYKQGKIYNWLTLPAIGAGLVLWLIAGLSGSDKGIGASSFAFVCGLIPFGFMALKGWLGGGDAKLMAAVGALSASWECVLGTAFYGLLVAMVMAIVIMIHRGIVRQTMSRIFGAILSTAVRVKPDLENEKHTVPFGAAVAVGGLLAGAEHLLGWVAPWTG